MKNIEFKELIKPLTLLLILLVAMIPFITCYIGFIKINSVNDIPLMIKNDPAVQEAKITSSDNNLFERDYTVSILFNDGNSIVVDHVNEFGKGKTMEIKEVNNHLVSIINKNTDTSIDLKQQLKFFSALTGTELLILMDIVQNYLVICGKVENWINLSDYKQDNEEINETRKRILAENVFPFPDSVIKFNEQEYFVYK